MTYIFNKQRIQDKIEEVGSNTYKISFNVPIDLKEDYDLLIEYDLGTDEHAILEDVVEEEAGDRIIGHVILSSPDSTDITELCFSRASQFDMLEQGEPLTAQADE